MRTIHKVLYQITPFIALCIYMIPLAVHTLITDGKDWGGVAAIMMLFLSLILIAIDFLFKKIFKKYYQQFIWESFIILLVLLWDYFMSL